MVLVAGGSTDQYANSPSTRTWLYDPRRDVWSATDGLLVPRVDASAIRLANGQVLLVGGFQRKVDKGGGVSDYVSTSCELYDSASGHWATTGSLPTGAGFTTLVRLQDGTVLALSGTLTTPQRYYPASQKWTAAE